MKSPYRMSGHRAAGEFAERVPICMRLRMKQEKDRALGSPLPVKPHGTD